VSRPEVLIVCTGTANLASIGAGLRRVGATPRVSSIAAEVELVERVVVPGGGAFATARARVREARLDVVLRERVRAGRPTLAICLGLQLLCAASDESPGVDGLGVIGVRVRRFPADVRVPQLGWNYVQAGETSRLLRSGYAYFATSYRLATAPAGWSAAYADHGGRFVAAFERGAVLACQFHPEVSGPWRLELLRRWLQGGGGGSC